MATKSTLRAGSRITSYNLRHMARQALANLRKEWVYNRRNAAPVPASWLARPGGFEAFVLDVGLPPSPNHCLVRRNKRAPWSKDNTFWSDRREDRLNRSPVPPVLAFGLKLSVCSWARHLGVSRSSLQKRLRLMDPEQAIRLTMSRRRRSGGPGHGKVGAGHDLAELVRRDRRQRRDQEILGEMEMLP